MHKGGYVYIMSCPDRTAIYVGVTSDLERRVWEHKSKVYPDSYSAKYNCVMLVYYQHFELILPAIAEEKRLKGGSRRQKEILINSINPEWKDLSEHISG